MSDRKPIPITFVVTYISVFTHRAGTEGHLLRLLKRLDRDRFTPSLVALQQTDWTDQYDDPDVPLHVMGFRSFQRPQDWMVISKLAKFLKQNKTQITELHFIDAHFVGALASHLAKVPVVLSCRRDLGHQYGFKGKWLMKLGNRYVNRFIANANVVADKMSQIESVDREKFEVIYNGVDLPVFDENLQQPVTPEFAKFVEGKRVVSIAANLRPVKNVALFIDAAARVAKQFDDVVFAIMGHGVLQEELEQQAARCRIADRTLFLGSVPHVGPYVARSDVACLSSHSEGFSNSVVEYMACSTPVVVTEVGGLPEAIEQGKTGFAVPAGDAEAFANRIEEILRMDDSSRKAMGAAGRRRVEERFTMCGHLDAHASLYEQQLELAMSKSQNAS